MIQLLAIASFISYLLFTPFHREVFLERLIWTGGAVLSLLLASVVGNMSGLSGFLFVSIAASPLLLAVNHGPFRRG